MRHKVILHQIEDHTDEIELWTCDCDLIIHAHISARLNGEYYNNPRSTSYFNIQLDPDSISDLIRALKLVKKDLKRFTKQKLLDK